MEPSCRVLRLGEPALFDPARCVVRLRYLLLPLATLLMLAESSAAPPLLRRSIPLPKVDGHLAHLTLDARTQRLFVAAYAHGSLEVIDLAAGQRVASISGLKRPRGLVIVPDSGLVVATCAGDGTVRAYDTRTLEERSTRKLGDKADHILLNDRTGQLLVGYGRALTLLQPRSLNPAAQIPLKSHPASFQLDPDSSRVFINLPGNWLLGGGRVAVADVTSKQVVSTWELEDSGLNYPMTYDAVHKLLYIVCRRPARLVALDPNSGCQVFAAECSGDADDMFLDPLSRRLYVIGGDGQVDVFDCAQNGCVKSDSLPTAPGARTGLLVPEQRLLYVAVPSCRGHSAEIREYALTD